MRPSAILFRVVSLAVITLVACGGESFQSDGDDDGAGQAGDQPTGGTAAAGAGMAGYAFAGTTSAGRGGTAGKGTGGASGSTGATSGTGATGATGGDPPIGGQGGSTSGSAGTPTAGTAGRAGAGGEGGTGEDHCDLPPETGPCAAAIERWFFNSVRGICEPFTYGGCEGNENNFENLEQCHAACAGHGEVDPTACDNPIECVLTARTCCGGSNPANLSDITAVNMDARAEFEAPCQLVDCASNIYPIPAKFGATCDQGHCRVFDIADTGAQQCENFGDCVLRHGLTCCEGCTGGTSEFIAINAEADLSDLICGDGPVGCPACVPTPDENISASCIKGRCEVVELLPNP